MKRTFWLPLLAAAGALLVALIIFGPLVYSPGNIFFEGRGDADKNYYTFIYHLLHDTNFWRLDGMAYPYWEHIVFADGQPMVSGLLQNVHHYIVPLGFKGAIGWHNSLIWVGLAFGAYFLCKLLIYFGTPKWYAVIGGIGLACLSPQHFRLSGHFALAYVVFFPWFWYSLLNAQGRKLLPWGLVPAVLLYVFGFIHVYYIGLGLFFGFGFYALQLLVNRMDWKKILKRLAVHVLLPFLMVRVTLWMTDPYTGRPQSPWGHFTYNTNFYGLIYPFHSERLMKHWPPFWHSPPIEGESAMYLGLTSLIFCWIILSLITSRLFSGKSEKSSLLLPPLLMLSLASAFFVLLYSMGFPLKMLESKYMMYLGPLRQFRATARFAWVFYYTVGVGALVYFCKLGQLRLKGRWKALIALPALVVFSEGYAHMQESRRRIEPVIFNRVPDASLDYGKYQAILPCPVFIDGSEITYITTQEHHKSKSLALSIQTGLPLVGIALTRSSWTMTLKLLPLAYEVYKIPPFVKDLPNKKPLLMLTPVGVDIRPMDKALLTLSHKVAEMNGFAYYEVPYEAFSKVCEDNSRKKIEEAHALIASGQALKETDFIRKPYDEFPSDTPFMGKGAAQFSPGEGNPFFEGTLCCANENTFILNFWMYLAKEMQPTHQLRIRQYNQKGEEISYESKRLSETIQAIDGYWGLMEYTFTRKAPDARIKVTIETDKDNYFADPGRILLDELTIRPNNSNLIFESPRGTLWNGRLYSGKVQ